MRRSRFLLGLSLGVAMATSLSPSSLVAQQPPAAQPQPPRGFRGGTSIKPGEECPAGTTEIRPNNCLAPASPPPSIVDYRPKSTLIVPAAGMKWKAKYPVVDFHGHPSGLLGNADGVARLGASMDSVNVRLMIAADNVSGDRLTRTMELVNGSPTMKDRVRVLTGVNLNGVGPGWAAKAVAQLEADAKGGAVGIGEIGKGFGLSTKKADGTRLRLNDPDLDPIWEAAARLNLLLALAALWCLALTAKSKSLRLLHLLAKVLWLSALRCTTMPAR